MCEHIFLRWRLIHLQRIFLLVPSTRVYVQEERWVRIREWIQNPYDLIHAYRFLQKCLLDPKDLRHTEVSLFYIGIIV
jgi:hypothetical protein